MTTLTLEIPRRVALNSNDRLHWAARGKRTAIIRQLARVEGVRAHLVYTSPVRITAVVLYARSGRHDAHNMQPTVKAAIDGFVDAGLFPDDSDEYLRSVAFEAGRGKATTGHVSIRFEFEEVS